MFTLHNNQIRKLSYFVLTLYSELSGPSMARDPRSPATVFEEYFNPNEERAQLSQTRSLPSTLVRELPLQVIDNVQNRHLPFIGKKSDGTFSLTPFLGEINKDLLALNELSYSMVKGHVALSDLKMVELEEQGWKLIAGMTGLEGMSSYFGDLSGLVYYNKLKRLIAVVYHGTSTIDDGVGAGWTTNINVPIINPRAIKSKTAAGDSLHALDMAGSVHKGFAHKYVTTQEDLLEIITRFLAKKEVTQEERENLRIVFTGHSQGAALGNLALYDMAVNHGADLFGLGFDNHKDPRFYGYFLSAPRVGNKAYVDTLHAVVGEECIIRQNLHGDPVPVALGKSPTKWLLPSVYPFLKETLNYKDSGYLLLDTSSDAMRRIKEKGLDVHYWMNQKAVIEAYKTDQVKALKQAIDLKSLVKEVRDEIDKSTGFWKVPKFLWSLSKGALKRIVQPFIAAPKAALHLGVNYLTSRVAHFHYGHDFADGRGAVFSSEVVGSTDLELQKMFETGLRKEGRL
ncbi:MAG: lipase family protein [Alphaproteobacteria bacterium]|jgi:hypothetical protein|nr:lipase family protein [Alphaproteobacteria bacterium]